MTGASRGIGAATARELHAQGATVVIHCNSSRVPAELLAADLGERVGIVEGDLGDPDAAQQVWADAVAAVGAIDVLVNNAGAWIASNLDDTDDGSEAGSGTLPSTCALRRTCVAVR
ncbi:MAG: SDR family NAD(P)-dependent oxidoreductase [Beutenbergiaceae bacterium]